MCFIFLPNMEDLNYYYQSSLSHWRGDLIVWIEMLGMNWKFYLQSRIQRCLISKDNTSISLSGNLPVCVSNGLELHAPLAPYYK